MPDADYAELTLAMRTGDDPGAVFDALLARGQIQLHPDQAALLAVIAAARRGRLRGQWVCGRTRWLWWSTPASRPPR